MVAAGSRLSGLSIVLGLGNFVMRMESGCIWLKIVRIKHCVRVGEFSYENGKWLQLAQDCPD